MKTFQSSASTQVKIPEIAPDKAREYFLSFQTREQFLALRDEWRALYAYVSGAIRSNRTRGRILTSWRDKLSYRMGKNPRPTPSYASRLSMATRNAPPAMDLLGHDATELMAIRTEMKAQGIAARAKAKLPRVVL